MSVGICDPRQKMVCVSGYYLEIVEKYIHNNVYQLEKISDASYQDLPAR